MMEIEKTTAVIDIFDPAMCCSTGVCGPDVDDSLTDFANDVKWLKTQGIKVNRFNLGQEPEAFKSNPTVLARLKSAGSESLPIIFVNGEIVSEGGYPNRQQLMKWVSPDSALQANGLKETSANKNEILSILEDAVTTGDDVEMRLLFEKGETLGLSVQSMVQAMQMGINNRHRVTQKTVQTANELLGVKPGGCTPGGGCC